MASTSWEFFFRGLLTLLGRSSKAETESFESGKNVIATILTVGAIALALVAVIAYLVSN
ncbi:MAG: hypothetical protein GXP26_06010 [Planctomycetes bacterium]|nr:hypothetical protein [Planctomycetota bacterium]